MIRSRSEASPFLALGVAAIALLIAVGVVLATRSRYVPSAPVVVLAEDLPVSDDLQTFSLDRAGSASRNAGSMPRDLRFPGGADVSVGGWAYVPGTDGAKSAVFLIVDERRYVHAHSHIARPDVAAALGNSDAQFAGFTAVLDTRDLRPGEHALRVAVVAPQEGVVHRSAPLHFNVR